MTIESFHRKGDLLHGWGTLHGSGELPYAAWVGGDDSAPRGITGFRGTLANAIRSVQEDKAGVDSVLYASLLDIDKRPVFPGLFLEWMTKSLRFFTNISKNLMRHDSRS